MAEQTLDSGSALKGSASVRSSPCGIRPRGNNVTRQLVSSRSAPLSLGAWRERQLNRGPPYRIRLIWDPPWGIRPCGNRPCGGNIIRQLVSQKNAPLSLRAWRGTSCKSYKDNIKLLGNSYFSRQTCLETRACRADTICTTSTEIICNLSRQDGPGLTALSPGVDGTFSPYWGIATALG